VPKPGHLSRIQLTAVGVLLALGAAVLIHAVYRSPDIPFVFQRGEARWIQYPAPISPLAIHAGEGGTTVFEHRFQAPDSDRPWMLRIRALGDVKLALNGAPLAIDDRENWKSESTLAIGGRLRPGENHLLAEVRNPRGPALLNLRIDGPETSVASGQAWLARQEGMPPAQARVADDTRPNPEGGTSPGPLRSAASHRYLLVTLFLLSCLAAHGVTRLPRRFVERLPPIVLGGVTLVWVVFFALKVMPMRPAAGFDVTGHLEYVRYLIVERRLPLAGAGWSTYHPPLFYLLSALVARAADLTPPGQPERLWILRIIPCMAGLANVWATYFVARTLFRGRSFRIALATAIAATLPMNIYMSAYVSNEVLHASLVSLALIPVCRLLVRADTSARRDAWLCGILLGLAILTKFTSLLVVPLVVCFVTVRLLLADRGSFTRAVGIGGTIAGAATVVGGWFYLRNWIHLGRPVVGNWEQGWWQQPGFHTPGYYLGFGEALRRPFFSGFHSFWDGIYSSLWGDGYVAGRSLFAQRHEMWSYDFMAIAYLLALPVTLIAMFGFARTVLLSFADPDPGRRTVWALFVTLMPVVGFSMLYLTLRLPYYAQAKAFYALCLLVPFSVTTTIGFDTIVMGRALRVLLHGWLGLFFAVVALSFLG